MGNVHSNFSSSKYIALGKAVDEKTAGLSCYYNLASTKLQATIHSVSDEFFGAAENLLKPEQVSPVTSIQKDGNRDGWQPERHCDEASVVIKFNSNGHLYGFDIDTTTYSDSAPTSATVEGLDSAGSWVTLLSNVPLKLDAHNFFLIRKSNQTYSKVRLSIEPGTGIARLRCYGYFVPKWPREKRKAVDLASAENGARVIHCSDNRQGTKLNIILNKSSSAEDGWESLRSYRKDRDDTVVIKLASPGTIQAITAVTKHFIGNIPRSITVEACYRGKDPVQSHSGNEWATLVDQKQVKANDVITYPISQHQIFTHVKLTLHPDGGLQQLRVEGYPVEKPDDLSHIELPVTIYTPEPSSSSPKTAWIGTRSKRPIAETDTVESVVAEMIEAEQSTAIKQPKRRRGRPRKAVRS